MAGRLDLQMTRSLDRVAALLSGSQSRVRGPTRSNRYCGWTVHGVSYKADLIIREKTRNEPVGLKDGGSKSVRPRDVVFTT